MPIRMPFPAEVNAEPDAKYHRSLAQAFPGAAGLTTPRQRLPMPNLPSALLAVALLLLICLAMSGCSEAEAHQHPSSTADLRRETGAVRACPGMTAVWLEESTVQCLKEKL